MQIEGYVVRAYRRNRADPMETIGAVKAWARDSRAAFHDLTALSTIPVTPKLPLNRPSTAKAYDQAPIVLSNTAVAAACRHNPSTSERRK